MINSIFILTKDDVYVENGNMRCENRSLGYFSSVSKAEKAMEKVAKRKTFIQGLKDGNNCGFLYYWICETDFYMYRKNGFLKCLMSQVLRRR